MSLKYEELTGMTPLYNQFVKAPDQIIIRLIEEKDLESVKQFVTECLMEFARNDAEKDSTRRYLVDTMETELKAQLDKSQNTQFNRKMWVAVLKGEVVGCIGLKPNPKGPESHEFAKIHIMSVKKEHRRKGIGELLFSKLESYCTEVGIQNLRVTTQDNLSIASPFYEKHGFKIETKKTWENLNLIKYAKNISPRNREVTDPKQGLIL